MLIVPNVRNALDQLWAHKMRSLLTVLGIVIAVTSVITVVSVIQGFTSYVSDFLQGLGTNAMWCWPERPTGEAGKTLGRVELDAHDIEAVERWCPALRRISPLIMRPDAKLRLGSDEISVPVEGVSVEYHAIRNFPVGVGRPFSIVDVERAHHACVVGREVLRKLRVDDGLVGGSILLDGQRFRVVGVLEAKGSFFGESLDNVVLIPYTTALKLYPVFRRYMAFAAQATSENEVPEARSQIVNLLRRRDIMLQFLTEATTLSLAGGGLGIVLGWSLSALASLHPQMVDIVVPWWAVMLGFGVSAGTGVVFGLIPAVKAALLNPIDALRHS